MKEILKTHLNSYPLMEPRDVLKLCYQSEFGPEHMISDPAAALRYILTEWALSQGAPRPPEDIGNGLVRFHLTTEYAPETAGELLSTLFCLTAQDHKGTREGLDARLRAAVELKIPGMTEALKEYRAMDCPPVHHSDGFRKAYAPHYRLLRGDFALYFPLLLELKTLGNCVVSVDGRCGSGKTGFAALAQRVLDCNVIHMDDFYLPMAERKENWREIPAGNMDLDRLIRLLSALSRGEATGYRPYSCQSGSYGAEIPLDPGKLTLVEGSYSQHPRLREYYYNMYFLTCPEEVRIRRLKNREGDYFSVFERLWIPMEENYLKTYPPEHCRFLDTAPLG